MIVIASEELYESFPEKSVALRRALASAFTGSIMSVDRTRT